MSCPDIWQPSLWLHGVAWLLRQTPQLLSAPPWTLSRRFQRHHLEARPPVDTGQVVEVAKDAEAITGPGRLVPLGQ